MNPLYKIINDQLNAILFLDKEITDLLIMLLVTLFITIILFLYWIYWIYYLKSVIKHMLKVEKHFLNAEVHFLQTLKKIGEAVNKHDRN